MSTFTYEQIKPLILSEDQSGSQMRCEFGLGGVNEVFPATGSIPRTEGMGGMVQSAVKRETVSGMQRGISGLLRGVFGGGIAGRVASTASFGVSQSASRAVMNVSTPEKRRAGVVAAFARVQRHFVYDERTGKWDMAPAPAAGAVSASYSAQSRPPAPSYNAQARPGAQSFNAQARPGAQSFNAQARPPAGPSFSPAAPQAAATDFHEQLAAHPPVTRFDKDVLARLLARVVCADGDIGEREEDFFMESVPSEFGTVSDLADADPISAIEAEELSAGVRDTLFMLGFTVAAIDGRLQDAELKVLAAHARVFGLSEARQEQLAAWAKAQALVGRLRPGMSREKLHRLADRLGLSHDDAERAKIRWMKRQ